MAKAPWVLTEELFLSENEVGRLLEHLRKRDESAPTNDAVSAMTDRLIIESLVFSGLRNSEFCRLRVCDTIVGTGESAFSVRGTPRQDRTVYVPQFVSTLVQDYLKETRPAAIADDIEPTDRRVVRILTAAGLGERASVQLLRHTYGYLGYRRTGGNLLFLQRQLGHAHPMVTSVYARFVDEDYFALADSVGGAIAQPTKAGPSSKKTIPR
jgi:integrase